MYLYALTNKMVTDTNSLSINKLPKLATSQNNVEYYKLQQILPTAH